MLLIVLSPSREYLSYDTVSDAMDHPSDLELLYPTECLNSVSIRNFPEHILSLKIGAPVVLLRNINQAMGLCNGTRLLLTRLGNRVLEATVMTGTHISEMVCIPRIVLNSKSRRWPFTLQHRQFPIRLCHAMTTNKCQGQTIDKVGIYLKNPIFTHDQLYIPISRVTSKQGLGVLIENEDASPGSHTKNIVYDDVLGFL